MKFTLSWLKSFLDTNASLEDITNKLTMIGLEVEEVIDNAKILETFTVAKIIEAEKHPEADKLKICKVATGNGDEILQIVCGAANARSGIKVALAKIGAVIPNGNFKIKESTIRGVKSMGMLCSAEELNLEDSSEGIIELPDTAALGESITKILGLDDPVIHINITPNRGDALGVYGIARDLAASGIGKLKDLKIPVIKNSANLKESPFKLDIQDPNICSLFVLRTINNINKDAQSPDWLKNYLQNVGITPRTPVVDITNYICYSFGRPMHAYDASKIKGDSLIIDALDRSEKFKALNGKEYDLESGDVVVRDQEKAQCIAGIIGGQESACDTQTTSVILEAACFSTDHITTTGRRLNIHTDSRYRFERGLDRNFTASAIDYATYLINEICGGDNAPLVVEGKSEESLRRLDFPVSFLQSRAGIDLSAQEICKILENLGFVCNIAADTIKITIPSWRHDVAICEDIVEEIVRIYGYDQIPEIILPSQNIARIIPKEQKRISDIKRLLAGGGYNEVVTWSFMDSKKSELFRPNKEELFIENPISSDLDYMRPSILPNLLKIVQNNVARGFKDLSIFEIGPIFLDNSQTTMQSASSIRTGLKEPKNSHGRGRFFDIFDIKADLAALLNYSGLDIDKCQIQNSSFLAYYHPTRSASINLGKNVIANFGQIHPSILKEFGIEQEIVALELNLGNLPLAKDKYGKKGEFIVSDYQAIERDYAFVIDQNQPIGEILNLVGNVNKNLIRSVNLFDIYTGDKIESGKKSVAFSVVIQDNNKTLTEEDIALINDEIIQTISNKFSAKIRDN